MNSALPDSRLRRSLLAAPPLGIRLLAIQRALAALFYLGVTALLLVLHARHLSDVLGLVVAQRIADSPDDALGNLLVRFVPRISETGLMWLASISTGYLMLRSVQAAGLWLQRTWVEYLVLVEASLFVPYQTYELITQPAWPRTLILVANLIVVGYLVRRRVGPARLAGLHQRLVG